MELVPSSEDPAMKQVGLAYQMSEIHTVIVIQTLKNEGK